MPDLLPNVRLHLANTPENVVLVREMLSGLAEAIGIGHSELNDIRTAVTEACNNVVLHAYEGEAGPMDIEVHVTPGKLKVLVRDHGCGIQKQADDTDASPGGIGLHVIRTLAHSVQFEQAEGSGADVRMEFAVADTSALDPCSEKQGLPTSVLAPTPSTTMLSIAPIGLARTVLPRLVSALAARAHFSTDRISDAQLLADALVAHVRDAMSSDQLNIGVEVEPREIELRIAPLTVGRAEQLLDDSELDGLGRVIEKLTDRRLVATAGSYDMLTLGLVDRR
jgi:serine/threonine-protein kinase RsbW